MSRKPVIIGSGQYNYDIIKLREYPDGFIVGKRNPYVEKTLLEEVGGTCGNVMCMLAHFGWDARPQVKLINSEEGKKLADSLIQFGCDPRYISLVDNGGFSGMMCVHRKSRKTGEHELGIRGFGPNDTVVDWEGCGDTVSAVFINELNKIGLPKVSELTEEQVSTALGVAVEKSALCTQYYGSKGWLKAE